MHVTRRSTLIWIAAAVFGAACSDAGPLRRPYDLTFQVDSETFSASAIDPAGCSFSVYCLRWKKSTTTLTGSLRQTSQYELTIGNATYFSDDLHLDGQWTRFETRSGNACGQPPVNLSARIVDGALQGSWSEGTSCNGGMRVGSLASEP